MKTLAKKPAKKARSSTIATLADLKKRLGSVPLDRILMHPPLGTATVADVVRIHEKEGRLCELIEGVLVEKPMGLQESILASFLLTLMNSWVHKHNLGFVAGPDGTMQLMTGLVRLPDVAFISWDRLPSGKLPKEAVPLVVPNLAVEVLSKGNTRAEMRLKRSEYFKAGVELVWEINPKKQAAVVYTSMTDFVALDINDTLDGGTILPGFQLSLKGLFGELDRQRS